MTSYRFLTVVVLVGAFLLVLPSAPIHLSYVYSDSMEPTISVGDGYLVVPAETVEPGDIVTFRSSAREEFITHRVVEVVEGGYLTRGDNNPSTDQAGGHPVVTDDAIVGRVLTVGGAPIVVPHLASVAAVASTYWPLWILLVLLGGSFLDRTPRARDVARLRDLLVPLVVTTVIGSAVVLAFAAPTYSMSLVAVAAEDPSGRFVPVGETALRTLEVAGPPRFTYQFVEGTGVEVVETAVVDGVNTATVAVPPQSTSGGYDASVTTYHYPTVLPYDVMHALHALHPFAAGLASILTLLVPLGVANWLVVDGKTPLVLRSRSRKHNWGWLK